MPAGKEPFENAPDLKQAFERARDDERPQPEQEKAKAGQPRPQLRPGGPMRGMARSVDRVVVAQDEARKVAERKAGREPEGRKPRRVTQLSRAFNRPKDKENEPEP